MWGDRVWLTLIKNKFHPALPYRNHAIGQALPRQPDSLVSSRPIAKVCSKYAVVEGRRLEMSLSSRGLAMNKKLCSEPFGIA